MAKFKNMEDFNATKGILVELYNNQNMTIREVGDVFGVSQTLIYRWFKDCEIQTRRHTSKHFVNENYFDEIDTEEKAYWLGFIWCDGTIIDHSHGSPQFKLSLSSRDIAHVYKFKKAINSNHNVHEYKISDTESKEARIILVDNHFTNTLRVKYRLLKGRPEGFPMEHIPVNLVKHFIRGVYDADGSITMYHTQEPDCLSPSLKVCIQLYSNIPLIDNIQQHFVDEGLRNRKTKTIKRHKDRDGNSTGLNISGSNQTIGILRYLYDNSIVHLDRKLINAEEIYEAVRARRAARLSY